MIVAAEFGTGQVLWSIVVFALLVLWFGLVFRVFAHIIGNSRLSGWGKAVWVLGIVFMPFLGIFLYLIVNGDADSRPAQARPAPISSATIDDLERLRELWTSGALSDDEYERAKSHALDG
ncbi:MAG: SHOCT domain-containing protein [Actinomycetia bacterium]|nr:SHOCT domain-containing protein [Actinomycetes bacterium]